MILHGSYAPRIVFSLQVLWLHDPAAPCVTATAANLPLDEWSCPTMSNRTIEICKPIQASKEIIQMNPFVPMQEVCEDIKQSSFRVSHEYTVYVFNKHLSIHILHQKRSDSSWTSEKYQFMYSFYSHLISHPISSNISNPEIPFLEISLKNPPFFFRFSWTVCQLHKYRYSYSKAPPTIDSHPSSNV